MKLLEILAQFHEHGLWLADQALDGLESVPGKVCVDNRVVADGDVFVCIKGFTTDGHKYISPARKQGACLIVQESAFADALPAIRVTDSRKACALLAKLFFANPSSRFRLVGITGTNGKTTTSLLLFEAVRELGIPAGWIGTLGYYINDDKYKTRHTTPDILELNAILAQMADAQVRYVFMEVSSHALALDRVYGIEFDFCLFTNLTREHLDFHRNMEEYGSTKLKLFQRAVNHAAIALINVDDSFGRHIYSELKQQDAYVFSVGTADADYLIRTSTEKPSLSWDQTRFVLQCPEGLINLRSPLIGKFNLANLALSAAELHLMGFEKRQIEQGLNSVQPVRGRFERVPNGRGIGVFVDYAHTPDALENVLRASREFEHGRIICLFGAGGERDKGKRPLMLKAALQHADAVIITDDNPRREDPDGIIRDIVTGTDLWLPWWILRDRRQAIEAALRLAQPGDLVLLCGKGHETYQEIGTERLFFDDHQVAAEILQSLDTPLSNEDELTLPVDRLILELLAGKEIGSVRQGSGSYLRISTDSRTIRTDSLFFALKGDNFDGNDFLEAVLNVPSVLAIGERELISRENYLHTSDSLALMAKLHRKYLLMFSVYKIGLTGSTGKSSTKELLAQVFGRQAPTLKTQDNENNLIGLCKTIARIKPNQSFAVFELGTNHPGEIAALCEVCSPDAGIILNIGPSHLEYLIDEDGVFREKARMFERPLELRLFDADDQRFSLFAEKGKSVGYSASADYRISDLAGDDQGYRFKLNQLEFRIPYAVPYYVKNASFAIAAGLLKGIPYEEISAALREPVSLDLRLQVEKSGSNILLVDCYNANPVSMQAAIEYWRVLEPEREHVAILADMLELGAAAGTYHDMVSAILVESGKHNLITVGDLSARYHRQDANLHGRHFTSVSALLESGILRDINPGSVILIKGSHSMHLEQVAEILRKEGST